MSEQVVAEKASEQPKLSPWPMSFKLKSELESKWYSYRHYRGPDGKQIQVLYSKSKEQAEEHAKRFLEEPVVGFDMEWPSDDYKRPRLQDKVSLIQVACEDKIALFHIGLHTGTSTEDLIAPSLRKLIESPDIVKTGVAIASADFSRLIKHFGLKPQAAFELSHLYRLVKYAGPHLQESEECTERLKDLTTKLVALDVQVSEQLGLKLWKGNVRTSDWSKELDWQQRTYAANDAYAGFMLYHRMNALRLGMDPSPPLPVLGNPNFPVRSSGQRQILLRSSTGANGYVAVGEFYPPKPPEEATEESEAQGQGEVPGDFEGGEEGSPVAKKKAWKLQEAREPLDATSWMLYDQLATRRSKLAHEEQVRAFMVASNAVLEALAQQRPCEEAGLLQIKGIGKKKQEKYGAQWIEVIRSFLAANPMASLNNNSTEAAAAAPVQTGSAASVNDSQMPCTTTAMEMASGPPQTPRGGRRRREVQGSPTSSPAFGSPLHRTPQLHTGLSFNLATTAIDDSGQNFDGGLSDASEGSSVYATPPSQPAPKLERKRDDGPDGKSTPSPTPKVPEPLTPRSRIFKNQLLALSRLVANKLESRAAGPIVSDQTLEEIVRLSPRTEEELRRIGGVEGFVQACKEADMNLLRNIVRWAPVRF